MQSNPYIDSFPRGSTLSPYASPASSRRETPRNSNWLKQHKPQRTSKASQKLVLFPEESEKRFLSVGDIPATLLPLDPGVPIPLPVPVTPTATLRTDAEKSKRDTRRDLPRVTSYSIADSYNLDEISKFLKDHHGINAISYDECLYAVYEQSTKYAVIGGDVGYRQVDMKASYAVEGELKVVEKLEIEPWMNRSEIFFFDYGVIVFWNFSHKEEIKFLPIFKKFSSSPTFTIQEPEEVHFQYDLEGPANPRIYNDIITLKSNNHLIKLTISHALAQSVKLTLFEKKMEDSMEETIELPQQMADYGKLRKDRVEVMKIIGSLFELRMDVNLVSNVLDTPELFWSEPELLVPYKAIRGYFEISQRASLLNKRVEVVSDILNMLSDHQTQGYFTYQSLIVVLLVAACVIVAILEVLAKILRLEGEKME